MADFGPAPANPLSLSRLAPGQVAGERYVYKFVCNPEALFSMAFPDNQRPSLKADAPLLLPPGPAAGGRGYDQTTPYPDGGEQGGLAFPDGYSY